MEKLKFLGLITISGSIFCMTNPVISAETTMKSRCRKMEPKPLVGMQRTLSDDEKIGGWYFCVRDGINKYLDKHQPEFPETYSAVITFIISNDGTLSQLGLSSSGEKAELDKSLRDAVEHTFPLKEKFDSITNDMILNHKFRMEFSKSKHPTCRFKIIQ